MRSVLRRFLLLSCSGVGKARLLSIERPFDMFTHYLIDIFVVIASVKRGNNAWACGALPSATAILRSQRLWPIRRMALPSVCFRNSASLQAKRLRRSGCFNWGRMEVGFGGEWRLAIDGAHELTIIAAIDAIAHEWPKFFRNGALQLDGEIGNTASAIDHIRFYDCTCWAGGDAGDATVTAFLDWNIHRQRQN